MYGARPKKISQQVTKDAKSLNPDAPEFTVQEANEAIKAYFKQFKGLSKWIESNQESIATDGFIYSHFGRKRRLPNVFSSDRGIAGHTTRSGINFLVQSPASDINLLAAVDMINFIEKNNMGALIFALVHDSILAEVPEAEVESYCNTLRQFVQADRGISIPGTPIGCDFEVANDYSMSEENGLTKYQRYEIKWDEKHENTPE